MKQLLVYFKGDALRGLAPWLSQDANVGPEDAWFLCADASGAIQMIPGLGEASPFDLTDRPADLPAIMSRLGETLRFQADHADGERFAPRPVGVVVCFGMLHELVGAWVKAEQVAATYESAWRATREREERARQAREDRDREEWKHQTDAAALELRNQEEEDNGR